MGKVLILTTISGFLCKFERENVRLLQELGYDVHYASNMKEQHYWFNPGQLKELNVKVHHIEIARSPWMFQMNMKGYRQLRRIVRKENISLVHCHTPVGGVLGRMLRIEFKDRIKIIYTTHGFHFYKGAPLQRQIFYRLAEKLLARFTDVLITINREDYLAARKFRLRRAGRVLQIPGVGLDLERFKPCTLEEKTRNRRVQGIDEKVFHLGTVAEINANKNHTVVLQALQRMKQKDSQLKEKIRYSIWGDGFLRGTIAQEIKDRRLEDVVTLEGYSQDVVQSLGTIDAFVFPSKREGLGMAALEALAMGIPVIASDNRGTREYMKHRVNGFVCKENIPQRYVEGIRFLRSLNLETKLEMEKQCQESTLSFCKHKTSQIMDEVYKQISEGN